MKITDSDAKLLNRLKELNEDKLTMDFSSKSTREGRRIINELVKRSKTVNKMYGRLNKRYLKKHPCIDED